MSNNKNTPVILLGAVAAVAAASLLYYALAVRKQESAAFKPSKPDDDKDDQHSTTTSRSVETSDSSRTTPTKGAAPPVDTDQTPLVKNGGKSKQLHARIEELDKQGKAFFKAKQFMEAAQCFTEALDLIADQSESAALARQALTLLNNRSAMYEKASLPELALEDCDAVLTRDPLHSKGRLRKLRLLESLQRYYDGLVQVCAIQLIFMQANRTNLRMGLPTPTPPIPQSKMEDILQRVLPQQVDKYVQQLADPQKERPLPSAFTIGQLLRSYSDYNTWNAAAARDGSIEGLTKRLSVASLTETERVTLLMKRGRRKVYEKEYAAAMGDLEQAYALTEANTALQHELEGDTYARLLEWIGMVWHWQHKLTEATACYQKCADLEPTKAILLVKQAGIQMDSGEQDQAMALLDMALGVDSKSVDALLHRSNLNMLRANPEPARKDLEACVSIRPSHTTARLRLASILAAANDVAAAESQLAAAEMAEPGSSEVQSYKGELLFMKGEMASAKEQFERAIELEAANPTPYVNVAMAILNTPPPPGEMPDAQAVMGYLEKAIKVDPQFMAAYIQLGQIKLGTATDLIKAREVIELYDVALEYCRSPEEIKEVCSMRILAVAQVDAATMLNMESFNMQ